MALLDIFQRQCAAPQRNVYFSDTFGSSLKPSERPDADVILCTRFRSHPFEPFHLEFDTWGQERATDHLLSLIVELHDQIDRARHYTAREKRRFRDAGTGVLVNAEPRTEVANGRDFHIARLRNNITVVSTGSEALRPVRDQVESLHSLPNEGNGLYDGSCEQFRSSYAGILLDSRFRKRFPLVEHDPSAIPESDEAWRIAWVDRFENVITYCRDPQITLFRLQCIQQEQGDIRLRIGDITHPITLGTSLGAAMPGQIVVYGNGNVDLVRKWQPADTPVTVLQKSAYRLFGEPPIGTCVDVGSADAA